jgi:P-type E1-E2 ATPase
VLLLWVAAGLAVVAGMPSLGVAIVVVVLVNGGFAVVQEHRADRAADRLRELMPARVAVRRGGRRYTVPAADLVPGDRVVLEAGDRVSADLVVVAVSGLAVDESTLTGESVPRRADTADRLYAGTFVAEGAAEAEVVATGTGTRLAEIAALTGRVRRPPSPLAVRLNRMAGIVAAVAAAVGMAFFGLAVLLGASLVPAFLLALGVTVALIPEGLLPTVTLALAWGSRRMAERNGLVRRLEAVETLGSVTFICTDKTGTLTRSEMAAVEVWTLAGTAHVHGDGVRLCRQVADQLPQRSVLAAHQCGVVVRDIIEPLDELLLGHAYSPSTQHHAVPASVAFLLCRAGTGVDPGGGSTLPARVAVQRIPGPRACIKVCGRW